MRYAVIKDNVATGAFVTASVQPANTAPANSDTKPGDMWEPVTRSWSVNAAAELIITINTVKWLREHLTSHVELAVRTYADANKEYSQQLKTYMRMVDARASADLIVSDSDYPTGPALMYSAGIIDLAKATSLIELGGHDASEYVS